MIDRRLYNIIKPVLPRFFQVLLRQAYVRFFRKRFEQFWPIDPNSGQAPNDWLGWPESKKFALVLTHDVETTRGLDRVKKLVQIEQELGFFSSFNFIPERHRHAYVVSAELREWLHDNGCEVGVHDLNHDGNIFSSEKMFINRAPSINSFLREWKARGFRAGSMYHNLRLVGTLDIEYDMSTFDTDPFEPQPDGIGTIFPFIVEKENGEAFVELPYTLAQDFTLFILLGERNIKLWTTKLDWIVSNGGMALLNTHPDYIRFGSAKRRIDEYPIDRYGEFLRYCRDQYAGQYWNALPGQVAQYFLKCPTNKSRVKMSNPLSLQGHPGQ